MPLTSTEAHRQPKPNASRKPGVAHLHSCGATLIEGRRVSVHYRDRIKTHWECEKQDRVALIVLPEKAHGEIVCHGPKNRTFTHTLSGQHLLIVPAGWSHRGSCETTGVFVAVNVDRGFVREVIEISILTPRVCDLDALIRLDRLLGNLVTAFERHARETKPPPAFYLKLLAKTLAAQLLKGAEATHPHLSRQRGLSPARLRRVCAYIEEHYAERISVADLAKIAYLSPSHFSRMFKVSTSLAPHDYLVQRRVYRAIELLVAGEMRGADIAAACGFSDQSHMDYNFRRLLKMLPSDVTAETARTLRISTAAYATPFPDPGR